MYNIGFSEYLPHQVHDRAQVFVLCPKKNKQDRPKYAGTIERWSNQAISLPNLNCSSPIKLLILVHNAPPHLPTKWVG